MIALARLVRPRGEPWRHQPLGPPPPAWRLLSGRRHHVRRPRRQGHRHAGHRGPADTTEPVDTNCAQAWYVDNDGDGWGDAFWGSACEQPEGAASQDGDCDDAAPYTHPEAAELADDKDNDCDGVIDSSCTDGVDGDGDGYHCDDCDDSNASVNPGATEVTDRIDNDCDGDVDEGTGVDADADGFDDTVDCDDKDPGVYPGAPEVPEGKDNDCDGIVDESGVDADGDGFDSTVDCNDIDATTFPGAPELRDGIDNDCNGIVDG